MPKLRAALVTPTTGPLARFGRESAKALTLWAERAADLPAPWTGVELAVLDADPDPGAALRGAARLSRWRAPRIGFFGTTAARPPRCAAPIFRVINVLSPASSYPDGVPRAVRALDQAASAVSLLHGCTGFGQDVASGATGTAREPGFEAQTIGFEPGHAAQAAVTLP